MDLDLDTLLIGWVVIAVVFAALELATTAFVAIYVSVGAIAAAIAAGVGGGLGLQLAAFSVVGVLLLLLTRPVLKGKLEVPITPTNVDAVIGRNGIVTIPIDNDADTGQIRVGSELWTARTPEVDGASPVIPVKTRVRVLSVEGVTARVELAGTDAGTSPSAGPDATTSSAMPTE